MTTREELGKILENMEDMVEAKNPMAFNTALVAIEKIFEDRYIEVTGTGKTVRELPTLTKQEAYEKAVSHTVFPQMIIKRMKDAFEIKGEQQ